MKVQRLFRKEVASRCNSELRSAGLVMQLIIVQPKDIVYSPNKYQETEGIKVCKNII